MSKPPEPEPLPDCPVCHQPAEGFRSTPWPPDVGTTILVPCRHRVRIRYGEAGERVIEAETR